MITIWAGGGLLVLIGVLDDRRGINPWLKLLVQFAAAVIAVFQDVVIRHINFFGIHIELGHLAIPITILWIVGLTNAINIASPPILGVGFLCIRRLSLGTSMASILYASTRTIGVRVNASSPEHKTAAIPNIKLW